MGKREVAAECHIGETHLKSYVVGWTFNFFSKYPLRKTLNGRARQGQGHCLWKRSPRTRTYWLLCNLTLWKILLGPVNKCLVVPGTFPNFAAGLVFDSWAAASRRSSTSAVSTTPRLGSWWDASETRFLVSFQVIFGSLMYMMHIKRMKKIWCYFHWAFHL